MTQASLGKNKDYVEAAKQQRRKRYITASKDFIKVLDSLPAGTPENDLDRAYINARITKCHAQYALKKIFKDAKAIKLDISDYLNNYNAYLALAESTEHSTAIVWAKTVKSAIAETRIFFSNALVAGIATWLMNAEVKKLVSMPAENFNAFLQAQMAELENFSQYYHAILPNQQIVIYHALCAFAHAAANRAAFVPQELQWYQHAIHLYDMALGKVSEHALVKPANLIFDKWNVFVDMVPLLQNKAEKIRVYQTLSEEFDVYFKKTSGKDFYHYRPTEYCLAVFYMHNAHASLAELSDNETEKAEHKQKAQQFQQEFVKFTSLSDAKELSGRHALNFLIALDTFLPCNKDRIKTRITSYAESSDSEEEKAEAKPASDLPIASSSQKRTRDTSDSDSDTGDDEIFVIPRNVKRFKAATASLASTAVFFQPASQATQEPPSASSANVASTVKKP